MIQFAKLVKFSTVHSFLDIPSSIAGYVQLYSVSKSGKNYRKLIPAYIVEMQRVSFRNWGPATSVGFYRYALSFGGAILWTVVKNLLFLPGSKMRQRLSAAGR